MIMGRDLAIAAERLNYLESITGFNVHLDLEQYTQVLRKHNTCTHRKNRKILPPADKRMYAAA